jgi:hypothetical protein
MRAGYDHRDAARPFFEKAVELDPGDAGAKLMLEQYDPNHKKAVPAAPVLPGEQA